MFGKQKIAQMATFTYLGSIISKDGEYCEDSKK